uniref:RING-type E3 ubiquitin transferase n=1 Tax=Salvator merianae TaxID=96440 RepID=A0A8D0BNU2_SALMN
MAYGNRVTKIPDEATCFLCLEYFKDPVTVNCGHNFCQVCITRCLEKAKPSCPQCRKPIAQRNFRPNCQLANLVELIKKLQLEKQKEEKRGVCGKHQEPLKLFCQEDQMCICLVCDKSKEHKDHNVLPLEEASQLYKGKINNQIPSLVKKRQELEALHSEEEQKSQKSLAHLKEEKEKILSAFEQLQMAIEENKRACLFWLDDLEEKMKKNREENVVELLNQITDLSSPIAEIEKKCQQPAREFLQDIADGLDKYDNAKDRELVLKPAGELEQTLKLWTQKREALETAVKDCEDSLAKSLQKVRVTLDPATAHPRLFISEDQKSIKNEERGQSPPSNAERFDTVECVLSCEKFIAGKHYWDVEIKGKQAGWLVGVARESVRRKGDIIFSTEEGVWAIYCFRFWGSPLFHLSALSSPLETIIKSSQPFSKIRVFLDYEAGRVAFSDACSGRTLFTFSSACFAGEVVRPFFLVSHGITLNCC